MKRRMPYGLANFEKIATGDYYYIDKTKYIEKLEQVEYPVFLRPRRFGKSLLTEMLRWYYDIKAKDRFQEIFGNLYIGKNPTGNQNKYFFLSLDFSGMDTFVGNEAELKEKFDLRIVNQLMGFLMQNHKLLNINPNYHETFFRDYLHDSASSLENIVNLVNNVQSKLYLCIDEYDSLTNALAIRYRYTNSDDNMYLNILQKGGFFRSFFEAIKSYAKTSLAQIYITGILP
jgi:hypothetical protein